MLAKQVLYCLSHAFSPVGLGYFEVGSCVISWLVLSWNYHPSDLSLPK
jgi:hypothetical protein